MPITIEEFVKAIRKAYDEMFGEYMPCPWCTGHIGYKNEYHDDFCIWLRIVKDYQGDYEHPV
jgi:hypothetical protein